MFDVYDWSLVDSNRIGLQQMTSFNFFFVGNSWDVIILLKRIISCFFTERGNISKQNLYLLQHLIHIKLSYVFSSQILVQIFSYLHPEPNSPESWFIISDYYVPIYWLNLAKPYRIQKKVLSSGKLQKLVYCQR